MTLLESAPDADRQESEEILYHLRRAFAPGDKNYHAQFWYARELCLVDKYEEARTLFATLGEANMPNYEKTQVRGLVRDKVGAPLRFNGSIVVVKPSYAFVQSDAPKLRVFVQISDHEPIESKDLVEGFPVSFELAFTLRGPIAQNLTLIAV